MPLPRWATSPGVTVTSGRLDPEASSTVASNWSPGRRLTWIRALTSSSESTCSQRHTLQGKPRVSPSARFRPGPNPTISRPPRPGSTDSGRRIVRRARRDAWFLRTRRITRWGTRSQKPNPAPPLLSRARTQSNRWTEAKIPSTVATSSPASPGWAKRRRHRWADRGPAGDHRDGGQHRRRLPGPLTP